MKRSLLALAVSASIVAPSVALADGPKVYGRMDLSLDNYTVDLDNDTDNDSGSNWEVTSHASRFGVKGDADLVGGLKAIYKLEWQVDGDGSEDADRLKERNRYVGIKGGFGAVTLGMMDTPLKTAQGKIDQFGDHAADIAAVVEGEVRSKNTIQYQTPKFGDMFSAKIALIQQEENETDGCDNVYDDDEAGGEDGDVCENGLFDSFSTSLTFSHDMFYASIAHDENVSAKILKDNAGRVDTTRLVGGLKVKIVEVGVLFSRSEEDSDYNPDDTDLQEQSAFVLSGAVTIAGKTKLKAQVASSVIEKDGEDEDEERVAIALGAEHKFTKQTKVYGEYAMLDINNVEYDEDVDTKESVLSLGIQHNF